jgi:ADP-ribosyl-[dinitrogen reductase] hydrolase
MNSKERLDCIQGCLMGVAIGDALGMPVETMKHEDIMQLNKGRGVIGFMPVVQKRVWDTAELKAGDTTDDWQLTRAVANSLIRTKGALDITDCANEHIRELEKSAFGWGKGSQSAIEAIRDGKRDPIKDSLPPAEKGKGCGNGVIMKIAPLAIANALTVKKNDLDLWHECKKLGSLTHPDIRASIAAYVIAYLMQDIIFNRRLHLRENRTQYILGMIIAVALDAEESEKLGPNTNLDLVSDRLIKLSHIMDSPNVLHGDFAETLRIVIGCGFNALDSVAFSIGTFLRHPNDFCAGVLEAVNAGGDSDTHASIVGALIGLNCGLSAIPKEWQDFSPHFQEALEIGDRLNSL